MERKCKNTIYLKYIFISALVYMGFIFILVLFGYFDGLGFRVCIFLMVCIGLIYFCYYWVRESEPMESLVSMAILVFLLLVLTSTISRDFGGFISRSYLDIEKVYGERKTDIIYFNKLEIKSVGRARLINATGFFKKNNNTFLGMCDFSNLGVVPCHPSNIDTSKEYVMIYSKPKELDGYSVIFNIYEVSGNVVFDNYQLYKDQQKKNRVYIFLVHFPLLIVSLISIFLVVKRIK